MKIETTILSNLIHNEEYSRKVIPFIREEYFQDGIEKVIFQTIWSYAEKYKSNPTLDALVIDVQDKALNEDQYKKSVDYLTEIEETPTDLDWLTDQTEKWCKDKAIYNAVLNGIQIIDGKVKDQTPDALPGILSEALSVSFDKHVGHDYMEQSADRYEYYHAKEEKIPFDLDFFNKITKGGLPNKTLNIALAGTGVGKSLFMCHVAAGALTQMKNVLYITIEMAEERIAERIDANLMNVPIDQLSNLSKNMFDGKLKKISQKGAGKLLIKEYPTGAANAGHFRALIDELKLKKNFTPDLICIDYLNICSSSRMKAMGGSINSYTYVKAIAEELRGLAVECNVPVLTATQTTRDGFGNSDVGLQDTSESFGLPATADLMFAIISTEELENLNQLMVKQLKNRYNDPTGSTRRFVVGVDRAKMRLYDIEDSAQTLVADDSNIGIKDKFGEFKV